MLPITRTHLIKYIAILAIILISIYIGLQINFFNNDDWVHYKTVENFLSGNFSLHPYLGSTFYSQGVPAFIFAKLFGITHLPVLTLIISVANIFIFWKILNLFSQKNLKLKILATSLIVLNPLYLYSSIGFMTENYVIFFLLLSIYSFFKYSGTNLLVSYAFATAGFFVKQYCIFINLALIIYLAVKKKWQLAGLHLTLTIMLILFYYFFFPKNEILAGQSVQLTQLFNFHKTLSLFLNIFLYLSFFTLPLSIIFILRTKANKIFLFGLAAVVFLMYLYYLQANEFPSIGNVLTQKGLFPDIDGNKSQWAGYYKFFTLSFYLSAVTSSLIISRLFLEIKNIFVKNKFLLISFILYFGLMLVLPTFYDRYLLPLVILWTLILFNLNKDGKNFRLVFLGSIAWLTVYAFFSYLYISDYIVRNIVVESMTQELISQGNENEDILANRGRNSYFGATHEKARYIFSNDKLETFDDREDYRLEKTIFVSFPLNIFTAKEIYLYKHENR
jgi:hypothetical protein